MPVLDEQLHIDHTFSKELPADPNEDNSRRQVFNACFSWVSPIKTSNPQLLAYSKEVAALIGLQPDAVQSSHFLEVMTGNALLKNSRPYAMCYGGHQFGNWAGQLGDGRAINIAEVVHQNQRQVLQLKGAGPTPYSRSADGLAVLRSSIREFLCSEAMHHLGIPTTRALSLALTGDQVLRDMLYDGNAAYEKGAIVCRVAPSFIRFGNFEIFAARKDHQTLQQLTDYTIRHFYPHLGKPSKKAYISFFQEVVDRTMDMVLDWQRVGFVHGVMNTDNFSILGLTIDYGPYGWLEGYDHGWTPNTTDRQTKRYRFGQQPDISLWNLLRLANALYPLIEAAEPLQDALAHFQKEYPIRYQKMMLEKLGILPTEAATDQQFINELLEVLHLTETDMTIFFRLLANLTPEDDFALFITKIQPAFYAPHELEGNIKKSWKKWFLKYQSRLQGSSLSDKERQQNMNRINPKYVLRNYMAQQAIDAADNGDYQLIDELLNLLRQPYAEQPDHEKWFAKRPEWARHKVGCSMLSCSS